MFGSPQPPEGVAEKFNEADWQRNSGRFANYIGRSGGTAGGAGAAIPSRGDPRATPGSFLGRPGPTGIPSGPIGPPKPRDVAVQEGIRRANAELADLRRTDPRPPPTQGGLVAIGELGPKAKANAAEFFESKGLTHDVLVANGRRVRDAHPEIVDEAKDWYFDAHDFAGDLSNKYGISRNAAAATVASLSPRMEWGLNKEIADTILYQTTRERFSLTKADVDARYEAGKDLVRRKATTQAKLDEQRDFQMRWVGDHRTADIPARDLARLIEGPQTYPNKEKAIRAARGESPDRVLKGSKVRSFYDNIIRPETSVEVTIDGRMIDALVGSGVFISDRDKKLIFGSPAKYAVLRDAVRDIARDDALRPHQSQAIIWVGQGSGVYSRAKAVDFSGEFDDAEAFLDTLEWDMIWTGVPADERQRFLNIEREFLEPTVPAERAIKALADLFTTWKFDEAEWVRSRGQFANYIGRPHRGGGAGGPTAMEAEVINAGNRLTGDAAAVARFPESGQRWRRLLDAEEARKLPASVRVPQEPRAARGLPEDASADHRAWADRFDKSPGVTAGPKAREAAHKLHQRAEKFEGKATEDIAEVAVGIKDAKMAEMQLRLRSEGSIATRLETESRMKGRPPDKLSVNDTLRYTMTLDRANYGENIQQSMAAMRSKGYKLAEPPKNYWTSGDGTYRGVNTVWEKGGNRFEVQYHTSESYQQKTANDPVYRVYRAPEGSIPPRIRGEAGQLMRESWQTIPPPGGLERFKALGELEEYFFNPAYDNELTRIRRDNGVVGERWTVRGWVFDSEVLAASAGGGNWSDYHLIDEVEADRMIADWLTFPETQPESVRP
jgi:hypothetical protein